MADNLTALDAALATIILAAKEIAGVKYPRSILTAPDGSDLTPLTDAQLRATAVPVSITSTMASTLLSTTCSGASGATSNCSMVPRSFSPVNKSMAGYMHPMKPKAIKM